MDTDDWVSITEAAARLTAAGDPVDRSTLSRYLKQHSEALELRPSGKTNLVEFGALRAHRAENIRIRPVAAPSAVVAGGRPAPRFGGSQSDGAARKAQADAEMREMDLAQRRKELVPVGEVDRAARESIALMQAAFEQALEADAASLAVRYGWEERTVRLALKAHARKGLDAFNREMLERISKMSDTTDVPPEE